MIDKIYGFVASLRRYLYEKKILKKKKLPKLVISIGNLSVGGTGKTPLTITISKYLQQKGYKTVVLSRGYKRKSKGTVVLYKNKNWQEVGDEPYLIFKNNIPVVVDSSRYRAGKKAIEIFNPDIFILDDGFQHFQLERDINILVVDLSRPFWEDKLLPYGRLREPLSFYKYADLFLITKWKQNKEKIKVLESFNKPFFLTEEKIEGLTDLNKNYDFSILKNKEVVVFSGLGNNKYFFDIVKELSKKYRFKIRSFLSFPDHYNYKDFNLEDKYIYLTTEKDLIKIKNNGNIFAIKYIIEIPESFRKFLILKVNEFFTNRE